jgi:hypothetical protein
MYVATAENGMMTSKESIAIKTIDERWINIEKKST